MADIQRVTMEEYLMNPEIYILVDGKKTDAPLCPYGNHFKWIGYNVQENIFVRFSTSVFKVLIKNHKK